MQVLWWLVPPLAATALAMIWAGWTGRERDEVRRDDADAALERMRDALQRPGPRTRSISTSEADEPSHGVAIRRSSQPTATSGN